MKPYDHVIYKGEPAIIVSLVGSGDTAQISIRNGSGGFHYVPLKQLTTAPDNSCVESEASDSLSQRTGMNHMVTIVLDRSQLETLYGIVAGVCPTYPNAVALKEMLGRYLR